MRSEAPKLGNMAAQIQGQTNFTRSRVTPEMIVDFHLFQKITSY